MAKPAIQVVASPIEKPFSAPLGDGDPVDVTLSKLKLRGQFKKAGINVDITRAITNQSGSNTMTDTIDAVPTLLLTVFDRDYAALQSGVFGEVVEVEVDGVPWRLMEVDILALHILQLTFYHKLVAVLMTHKSPLTASRASMTRAQFVEYLLLEILSEFPDLIFVCPEVEKTQPVSGPKKTGRSLKHKTLAQKVSTQSPKGAGFGVTSLSIRTWDGGTATLGPQQLHNASLVMDTCAQLNAGPKATLAIMEACSVEPDKPYGNPGQTAGSGGSAGILQFGGGGTSLPSWATDVVAAATHALQDPGATSKGGIISLARSHPELSAGSIAQVEQGSAYGSRYDQAQAGAQAVIDAYTKAGGFAATGASGLAGTGATTSTYNFTRGQSGATEDSWTCIQRLASEVQWRAFVTGRRSLWFVTDDDLLALPPKYLLDSTTEGVGLITGVVELGGRTVVHRGKRQPKPSEGSIAVRISRFDAHAGDPIVIADHGPYDGTWILTGVDRDLFDKVGTLTFRAPQKALREPAAQSTSVATTQAFGSGNISSSLTSSNPIDRVYAAATAMDARNLPYNFSGHTGSWSSAVVASGQDCSSSVSIVLYQAGLMPGHAGPIVSGDFNTWGQPGQGSQMTVWYSSGHVFIQFYGRPAKRFDTVPGGSGADGPHLRYTLFSSPTAEDPAGGTMQPRHWPNF